MIKSRQLVVPWKRVEDRIGITVDFGPMLAPGESIEEVSAEMSVYSGIDPAPEDMLLDRLIDGTKVTQRIELGLGGVIYQLAIQAETDQDNTLIFYVRQAVLEDSEQPEPIYSLHYFTSTPYPINWGDSISSSLHEGAGRLAQQPKDLGEIQTTLIPGSGILKSIVIHYSIPPESIQSTLSPVEGTLRKLVHRYTCPPEWMYKVLSPVSGELTRIVIRYNHPAEGIQTALTPVGGSLDAG